MSLYSSLHCLKRIDLYSMLIKHRQLKEINLHLEYSQIFQSRLKSVRLKNLSTMDSVKSNSFIIIVGSPRVYLRLPVVFSIM